MASAPSASLKSKNRMVIWSLIVLDGILLCVFLLGIPINSLSLSADSLYMMIVTSSLGPIVAGFLNELVSSSLKATLVFWRFKNVLPGHYAFTVLANNDARIDVDKLKEKIGELPQDPSVQNKLWYQLYRKHESDVRVESAHRSYLLYRDCASLTFLVGILILISITIFELEMWQIFTMSLAAILQYCICIIATRNTGERFVQNVLVAESM